MRSRPKSGWIRPDQRPIYPELGFRATFGIWAEGVAGHPHAAIEEAMVHWVGGQVERAYRRTDVPEERRELMSAWANYCEGGPTPKQPPSVFPLTNSPGWSRMKRSTLCKHIAKLYKESIRTVPTQCKLRIVRSSRSQ
jgi:hypothetical protein